jgi:preprotein translocase subunit SecD
MTRRVPIALLLALVLAACSDGSPKTSTNRPSPSISTQASGTTDNTLHAQSDATPAQLEAAKQVLLDRLTALGHPDAEVEIGRQRLVINGPALSQDVLRMLARPGRLEFRGVDHVAEPAATSVPSGGPSAPVGYDAVNCTQLGERLASPETPADRPIGACSFNGKQKYALSKVVMTDEGMTTVKAAQDEPKPEVWRIELTFDAAGTATLAQVSKTYEGRQLAILVDGVVLSAPTIANQITAGEAYISGDFTEDQARTLVAMLTSDEMPIPLLTSQLP